LKLDIAIIGASSSGLYAAARLARAGKRVTVFEQHSRLAPARRTLIITPRLLQLLGPLPADVVLHQTRTMSVVTTAAQLRVCLHDPDLIIERGRMTRAMAQQALDAGAHIEYGRRFRGLAPHPEGIRLWLRNDDDSETRVTATAVIGADGMNSDVARAVGLRRPATVPILQAEVKLPAHWNPDVTQVWFDTNDTRFFYWLIPESLTHGVVGLVGEDGATTRRLLQQFLARHDLEPLAYQGAQVAMYDRQLRPSVRVGDVPVLLVGDAAGQVKITTVGGSVSGFWGAEAAVQSLLHNRSYARELRSLRHELDLHWLLRELLDCADNHHYNRMVRAISPEVLRFLENFNRDEMAWRFWPMVIRQPALIRLGLALMLRRFVYPRCRPAKAARVARTVNASRVHRE
jgi:flavin-dependent dehydrogenase